MKSNEEFCSDAYISGLKVNILFLNCCIDFSVFFFNICHILNLSLSLRALIAGGGAPETELALKLAQYAQTITGVDAYCFR